MSNTQDNFKRVDKLSNFEAKNAINKSHENEVIVESDQNLSINYEWTSKQLSFEDSANLARQKGGRLATSHEVRNLIQLIQENQKEAKNLYLEEQWVAVMNDTQDWIQIGSTDKDKLGSSLSEQNRYIEELYA